MSDEGSRDPLKLIEMMIDELRSAVDDTRAKAMPRLYPELPEDFVKAMMKDLESMSKDIGTYMKALLVEASEMPYCEDAQLKTEDWDRLGMEMQEVLVYADDDYGLPTLVDAKNGNKDIDHESSKIGHSGLMTDALRDSAVVDVSQMRAREKARESEMDRMRQRLDKANELIDTLRREAKGQEGTPDPIPDQRAGMMTYEEYIKRGAPGHVIAQQKNPDGTIDLMKVDGGGNVIIETFDGPGGRLIQRRREP